MKIQHSRHLTAEPFFIERGPTVRVPQRALRRKKSPHTGIFVVRFDTGEHLPETQRASTRPAGPDNQTPLERGRKAAG